MMYVDSLDTYILPQRADLFAWSAAESFSSTPLRTLRSTGLSMGYVALSTSAQNHYQTFAFLCDAGTYTLTFIHLTGTIAGIATISIDGASVGTFDMYSASTVDNVVSTITGVAMTAGNHTMQIQCPTKNASSTAYQQYPQSITLTRTGS